MVDSKLYKKAKIFMEQWSRVTWLWEQYRKGRHVETIPQLSAQQHEMHRLQALPEFEKGLLLFCHSVVSNSLCPHGLQHAILPYPLSSPWACSNSCLFSRWSHPTISSSAVPFYSCLQSFPASGFFFFFFSSESVLLIRWLKYWSFSISPSK